MDYIGPIISPHREVIRYMACLISISHCIFGFKKIHMYRVMGQCRVEPLLGAIVMAIFQYYRNLMAGDIVKSNLNLLALMLYSIGLFVFYITGDAVFKCCVRRKVCFTIGVMLLCMGFLLFAGKRLVAMGIRGVTTLTLGIMFGAPILKLPHILAIRNYEEFSLKAMAYGCVASLIWIMYGMAWADYAILNRNIAILGLELIPLIICITFKGNEQLRIQTGNNSHNDDDNNDSNIFVSPLTHSTPVPRPYSSRLTLRNSQQQSFIELSGTVRSSLSLISAISATKE